jgi:hypothetical protein
MIEPMPAAILADRASIHSELSEALAVLTQLPRQAHPILPLNAGIALLPRSGVSNDDGYTLDRRSFVWNPTMSMLRPIAWLAAVVAVLMMAESASAQSGPMGPGVGTQMSASAGSDAFWQFQPFIDPGYFQPDFQFFAPAEVSDFGGGDPPNHGVYVTFDRTYVNVSRPRNEFSFGSGNQGDFTWGNRMEVGYMTGDPTGWQAVLWHVNGPNENFVNAEFLQQFLAADGTTLNQIPTAGAIDSINQLKMSSFELNKVWRQKPLHNGTIVEPLIGYRYMNVRDFFQRQALVQEVPDAVIATPFATANEFLLVNTRNAIFENQMHGGQLGARIFRQRGHWLLSADLRFFGLANFQTLRIQHQQSILPNPDVLNVNGTAIDTINFFGSGGDVNRTVDYHRFTQFCWGGEARAEASYELTRDINLRFGLVFLDLGQGIGRGDQPRLNNQAVQMAGVTFGFTVNR